MEECVIRDDGWPTEGSIKPHLDTLTKQVLDSKSQWLNEDDVWWIYYLEWYRAVFEVTDGKIPSGLLSNFIDSKAQAKIVEGIFEYFESIPRDYDIYLPIPNISKKINSNIPLGDDIEFVSLESEPPGLNFEPTGRGLQSAAIGAESTGIPGTNKTYLLCRASGYCSNKLENALIINSLSKLKVILQQCIARGFMKSVQGEESQGIISGILKKTHSFPKLVIRVVDKSLGDVGGFQVDLPLSMCKFLAGLDFDWVDGGFLSSYEKDGLKEFLSSTLSNTARLASDTSEDANRIKSAIEWCFDAYTTEHETMSFIQACIGLEAIYGEKTAPEKRGLTETLADRCGYLVGTNFEQRRTVTKRFKKLYDIRSNIVHGNVLVLDSEQKYYKQWGQGILEISIAREMKHLISK